MTKRIAVLDLGTNTFNLLIADMSKDGHSIIFNDKKAVKIGEGGISQGIISVEAEKRTMDALTEYKSVIEEHDVDKIYGYATSAFRNAVNGKALRDRIKKELKISISIISGEKEAEYIYYGVTHALDIGNKPALIVDIGGGSVEFIVGNNKKAFWKRSFEIGAQRLLSDFHHVDPIPEEELANLETHFKKTLKELIAVAKEYDIETLIGSSGSFDTLSEIYCAENGISFDHKAPEFLLDIDSYHEIHRELILKNKTERLKIPGMIEMRVDMIVVASCLIAYLIRDCKIKNMRVSSHSLKEGMLDLIRNELFYKERISA